MLEAVLRKFASRNIGCWRMKCCYTNPLKNSMTISVGIHWCLTPNFPFGDLYLSTIWPVLFIMIAANRSWLPIISGLAMCVASQIQKFVEVRLLQQHLIVVLNAKLVRHPQELIYVPVTAGLALATSHSYFYAGLQLRGLFVDRYVSPVVYLFQIHSLEELSGNLEKALFEIIQPTIEYWAKLLINHKSDEDDTQGFKGSSNLVSGGNRVNGIISHSSKISLHKPSAEGFWVNFIRQALIGPELMHDWLIHYWNGKAAWQNDRRLSESINISD